MMTDEEVKSYLKKHYKKLNNKKDIEKLIKGVKDTKIKKVDNSKLKNINNILLTIQNTIMTSAPSL
jgi:hypothetical protein